MFQHATGWNMLEHVWNQITSRLWAMNGNDQFHWFSHQTNLFLDPCLVRIRRGEDGDCGWWNSCQGDFPRVLPCLSQDSSLGCYKEPQVNHRWWTVRFPSPYSEIIKTYRKQKGHDISAVEELRPWVEPPSLEIFLASLRLGCSQLVAATDRL